MKIWKKIASAYRKSERFFHLMAGIPSYDKYLEHMQKHHPDQTPLTRKEFFEQVQEERYGSGGFRRC